MFYKRKANKNFKTSNDMHIDKIQVSVRMEGTLFLYCSRMSE